MQPLLSILIPTVVGREEQFNNLVNSLFKSDKNVFNKQDEITGRFGFIIDNVEISVIKDSKEITIGEKREQLYKMAKGLYSIQVDDDDLLAPNAIQLILEAIKSNPEIPCITFRESCMIDGVYKSSNHSIKYEKWQDNFDGYDYVRSPFYKDVIRTDIAKKVPFEKIRWNEDERQSYALKPFLTDEIHIDQELYLYIHNSSPSHERYGFDKDA